MFQKELHPFRWYYLQIRYLLSLKIKTVFSALLLPSDSISKLKSPTTNETKVLITHMVEKGDFLNKLALQYRCSVNDIMEWNGLKGFVLTSGNLLKIWVPDQIAASLSEISTRETKTISNKSFMYTVQKGDTLFSISQKFTGASVTQIKQENNLIDNSLTPGTHLKINILTN